MVPQIAAYWYRGSLDEGRNFGDAIAPLLLSRLAGISASWTRPGAARLITIGSVVGHVPDGWSGVVLGSSSIDRTVRRDLSRARVLAVRGRLTRDACRLSAGVLLADPGILIGRIFTRRTPPRRDVLVVPHYVDRDLAARHVRPGTRAVDVLGDPAALVDAIAGARLVITSSLHAMIAADALGVPHLVSIHPRVVGGAWKFEDYASAFGMTFRPGVERLTPRPAMLARQEAMAARYAGLGEVMRGQA